ncbi:MAG TPA: NAD-glutamate dehydrogenase, partial [Mycobacterium sp.]|nr:NAD-glutamate dehydrogenase [Mycobacterium sp.]
MTGNPTAGNICSLTEGTTFTRATDIPDWIAAAYTGTYRGPHTETPEPGDRAGGDGAGPAAPTAAVLSPEVLSAHCRLGNQRRPDDIRVAVYPADDPAGFGPAVQVVTGHGEMLMDSVAVLLHRLGVGYVGIMNPVFTVHRDAAGNLVSIAPTDAATAGHIATTDAETWIHVQLAPDVDPRVLAEAERVLPAVLADVRQVSADATAMIAAVTGLAERIDTDPDHHFDTPDRRDVAALLRWLVDGHFVVLGYQHGAVHDGQVDVDEGSRLGVLRLRKAARARLTADGRLLVLAQATVPSYLRFGAYPYIVVIRETADDALIEHRFIGLLTVAAMNANVLEIPVLAGKVQQALELSERDPSHPGQLLLDILQTIPRSELFAMNAQQLLTMAMAVVDLGTRRRALLFARADQLGRYVSCLVYLPRD